MADYSTGLFPDGVEAALGSQRLFGLAAAPV